MKTIPESTQVLIVGGGPAGSTAATLLARNGFHVTLLERDVFPRYHIGESLLPSCLKIFDLLGVREKIESAGFIRKPGAYLHWGGEKWSLRFGELQAKQTYSFQVIRSEFDNILLRHAEEQGVQVFEKTQLDALSFEGDRPVSASWSERDGTARGKIRFEHLIDASGRAGVVANRYLKSRRHHNIFQNVAIWNYWKNVRVPHDSDKGAICVGSIPKGWLWAIPLNDGTTSVGVVMHKTMFQSQRPASLDKIYRDAIELSPLVKSMLTGGEVVEETRIEQDYSYTSESFSGPGYYISGDSACFLDPLLSSGVHLAMYSALLAAASISSIMDGDVSESTAARFYEQSYRQAYLRFLVFVSTFYDQERGQEWYFRVADGLTQEKVRGSDFKLAFLNLVSGIEDMSNAEHGISRVVIKEMSEKIQENLRCRQDKESLDGLIKGSGTINENNRFFDAVEGLSVLSADHAIDGYYVKTFPRLGVARAHAKSLNESKS